MALEPWVNPLLSRRTCSPRYGPPFWRGESAGVAKRPSERFSPPEIPTRYDSQLSLRCRLCDALATIARGGAPLRVRAAPCSAGGSAPPRGAPAGRDPPPRAAHTPHTWRRSPRGTPLARAPPAVSPTPGVSGCPPRLVVSDSPPGLLGGILWYRPGLCQCRFRNGYRPVFGAKIVHFSEASGGLSSASTGQNRQHNCLASAHPCSPLDEDSSKEVGGLACISRFSSWSTSTSGSGGSAWCSGLGGSSFAAA